MQHEDGKPDDQHLDWDEMDDPPVQDDFYDDLSHLYLVSGEVWPEALSLENLFRWEQALRINDFFEDLAPDLEK